VPVPFDPASLVSGGKNAKIITCVVCKTKILPLGKGSYLNETIPLVSGAKESGEREESDWWQVNDIWDFANVGFSHSVSGKKYLTCAACEQGVLGVHMAPGGRILVAATRVNYV